MMSKKAEFAQQLAQRGLLWSYELSEVGKLPDNVLIEHGLVYGDVPDIKTIFEIFPKKMIKSTWEKVLLPNPNHRKLNYYLAIMFFHIKKPYLLLNQSYETRFDLLQRLAAENS
jgi:hypothetical protein